MNAKNVNELIWTDHFPCQCVFIKLSKGDYMTMTPTSSENFLNQCQRFKYSSIITLAQNKIVDRNKAINRIYKLTQMKSKITKHVSYTIHQTL